MYTKAAPPRRDLSHWALVGLITLAAILRLFRLGQESLWFDEGWTAQVARLDWPTLWNVLRTQPFPLYYALIALWARLGDSEVMLRLLSAAAGTLAVPTLYWVVQECSNRTAAWLAALLLAVSPLHVWYSQEARMYALATWLGLLSTWAFLRALRDSRIRWWALYAISVACALYTFYYTGLIFLAHGLCALHVHWRERQESDSVSAPIAWLLATAATLLLFLPGLRVLLGQVVGGTWGWLAAKYGRPSLGALLDTALAFSTGNTWSGPGALRWVLLAAFALAFVAAIGGPLLSRQRLDKGVVLLLLYLGFPIALVFLASQLWPAYLTRYLVLFLPPYCALLAQGLRRLARPLAAICLGLMLLASALSLASLYGAPQKEDWREAGRYVQQREQHGDAICLVDEDISAVFSYYYHGALPTTGVSGSLREPGELDKVADRLARYPRIWLVVSHAPNEALLHHMEASPRWERIETRSVLGVQLALFRLLG